MKLGLLLAACSALVAAAAAPASPTHAKVLLRSTSLGRVLVDARGHTLYLFGADRSRKSTCYGACATTWPPFLTSAAPLAGAGVKQGLLATTKRRDGRLQVLYAGHPLYVFSGDTRAGQTKGQGIKHFGGTWSTLNASGRKLNPVAPPIETTPTDPPDYGGYGP